MACWLSSFLFDFSDGSKLLTGSLTLSCSFSRSSLLPPGGFKGSARYHSWSFFCAGSYKMADTLYQVLPASSGGIVTGVILAYPGPLVRPPLWLYRALLYITTVPTSPMDDFSVWPIQIYNWLAKASEGFIINATAAITYTGLYLYLKGIAIYLRNKWQKKVKW